jgi:hypothetical protein
MAEWTEAARRTLTVFLLISLGRWICGLGKHEHLDWTISQVRFDSPSDRWSEFFVNVAVKRKAERVCCLGVFDRK